MDSKRGKWFIIGGLLLIAAALLLTGYNLWQNYRSGAASGEVLEELLPLIEEKPDPVAAPAAEPSAKQEADSQISGQKEEKAEKPEEPEKETPAEESSETEPAEAAETAMPAQVIRGSSYIGILRISSLYLELPVMDEWSYDNLNIAPCRYSGSLYDDDLVICGHNYSAHFATLKSLTAGDTVTFTDMDGSRYDYTVSAVETLDAMASYEMTSGDWDLTLFTCTVGGAARVAVRCDRSE